MANSMRGRAIVHEDAPGDVAASSAGDARHVGRLEDFRRRATPWVAAAADTIVPLSVGVAAVLIFTLLEQARDALFGALGSELKRDGEPHPIIEGQELFWYYASAAIVFGNLLWYTARVMAATSIRDTVSTPCHGPARTHYPRLLAYLLTSLLIAVALSLARDRVMDRSAAIALAGLSLMLPAVLVPLAQKKFGPSPRWAMLAVVLTLVFESTLLALKQPEVSGFQTVIALTLASTVPTACYVLWVMRRSLLTIKGTPDQLLASHGRRMYGFIAAFALIFAALAFVPASIPRALGSPGIVMIALNGILVGLVGICLLLRTIERRLPGLVVVGALAALAAAVLLRLAYQVEPWREVPGNERLEDASAGVPPAQGPAPAPAPPTHDIVVNAYGGGLRAAFFTAGVLARMDDASCGAFGQRLTALSGVSGGSLGVATYLAARQRVIAAGGWKECDGETPVVGALVEDVLRRDHLSPVVARMFTIDLLPYVVPRRGQALLDSWDKAVREATSERLKLAPTEGLAMPLTSLTGGISPAPLVLFNATDAANGKIFWMSNRGRWGREGERTDRPIAIRLGEAVLHSARFPLVSPVGEWRETPTRSVLLVDGGLSDVSGIFTLSRQVKAAAHWINIDGNFDRPPCNDGEPKAGLKTWSTLNALLELRGKQASLAIERMGQAAPVIHAKLDFAQGKQDPKALCEKIAKLHLAPLGWYMSVRSAQDMKPAIIAAADRTCKQLGSLCSPPLSAGLR